MVNIHQGIGKSPTKFGMDITGVGNKYKHNSHLLMFTQLIYSQIGKIVSIISSSSCTMIKIKFGWIFIDQYQKPQKRKVHGIVTVDILSNWPLVEFKGYVK